MLSPVGNINVQGRVGYQRNLWCICAVTVSWESKAERIAGRHFPRVGWDGKRARDPSSLRLSDSLHFYSPWEKRIQRWASTFPLLCRWGNGRIKYETQADETWLESRGECHSEVTVGKPLCLESPSGVAGSRRAHWGLHSSPLRRSPCSLSIMLVSYISD